MNLFNITLDRLNLLAQLEANDGEFTDELAEQLAINQSDFEEKATGYFHFIKHLEGQTTTIQAEIDRLTALKSSKDKAVARLKSNLLEALKQFGTDTNGVRKFDGGTFQLSTRRSQATEVFDENLVPDEFKVKKEMVTVSKTTIKNAIDMGQEVPGARIVTNVSLQIQ